MRMNQVLVPCGALLTVAIFFVALVIFTPVSAQAGAFPSARFMPRSADQLNNTPPRRSPNSSSRQVLPAPRNTPPRSRTKPSPTSQDQALNWPEAKVIIARPHLDLADEVATLRALHQALNEVSDGSTYVWHQPNGYLSGIIKPTMSFRDAKGSVCRHLEVWLTAGSSTKKTESIACREANRVWSFSG